VREIQWIPEASLVKGGRCNRYRSFLAGHGTIDPGIRALGEPATAFQKVGSERIEDIHLDRFSLREQL
jgi:hypothetical protein